MISGFPIANGSPNSNGGGGGGTYRGGLSLAPTYTLTLAETTTVIGGSITSSIDGMDTLTTGQLEPLPEFGNSIAQFMASSSPLLLDRASQLLLYTTFVWPQTPPTETGYFGVFISDEDAEPVNLLLGMFGQQVADTMYGVGVITLFSSGTIQLEASGAIDGVGSANLTPLTVPTGGDVCHLMFDPSTGDTTLYVAATNQSHYLGALAVNHIASGKGLKLSLLYLTPPPATEIPAFIVGFGVNPFSSATFQTAVLTPLVLPALAVDGDYLRATTAGTFGTKTLAQGDYFVLTQSKTDCIVLREPNGVAMTPTIVNTLILAAVQTGQPVEQVIQAYILLALANYNDKTGLNIVGDWDASSVNTVLSNFAPVVGLSGSVSAFSLTPILPLTEDTTGAFNGRNRYFQLEDPFIPHLEANSWSFDFIMPDLATLDSALYFELRPTGQTFYDLGSVSINNNHYARITYQDGVWSGAAGNYNGGTGTAAGDRLRIKLNAVANTITVYRLAEANDPDSLETYLFNDVFVNGFPTGHMKAAITFTTYDSNTPLTTFRVFGSRYLVTPPMDYADKNTYRVSHADGRSFWGGKPLKANDFATFYNNRSSVAIIRELAEADLANIVPTGVYRQTGAAGIDSITEIYIALSTPESNSYVINTDLTLVTTEATKEAFDLRLTSEGVVEDATALKDGLTISVKVDTLAGGEVTAFNSFGFYGELINTIHVPANQVTLLSYVVTKMFDSSWHFTMTGMSVIG